MTGKIQKKLNDRIEKGTLRSLSSYEGMVDFLSNDYLGFARNNKNIASFSGATGSRLISGNTSLNEGVEKEIASFFQAESGLMFNSGYDANLGIFSSIPMKGDIVFYDELIHASVRDGLRLSLAKSFSFKHNDLDHLESMLINMKGDTIYIAVEALYSMNGDFASLEQLYNLAKKYQARLIVDEAHSAGIFGERGVGLSTSLEIQPFLRLITFGKAYGSHGAMVLCESFVRDFLINFARSFVFTTALPPAVFEHNASIIKGGAAERDQLQANITLFRNKLNTAGLMSDVKSPIQIIRFQEASELDRMESLLKGNGIAVKAIYPPTVPEDQACLRICIHSFNSEEEIDRLVQLLSA